MYAYAKKNNSVFVHGIFNRNPQIVEELFEVSSLLITEKLLLVTTIQFSTVVTECAFIFWLKMTLTDCLFTFSAWVRIFRFVYFIVWFTYTFIAGVLDQIYALFEFAIAGMCLAFVLVMNA